jgi:hypothetical protein
MQLRGKVKENKLKDPGFAPQPAKKCGKSGASFCRQVVAWVPAMFCYFYLVKNHKIAK